VLPSSSGPRPAEGSHGRQGQPAYRGSLGQFLKATRSVSANIAHDRATSANSWRVGLGMRLPLRGRPPPRHEPGGWMCEDTGNRTLLLPPKGILSAGHPTEAGACVHAPKGGRSLTSTIRSASRGYADARRSASETVMVILGRRRA
jgi:hypothetical protein